MKISQYFTWEEVSASQEAARRGIDNTIPVELHANALRMAMFMDDIRHQLGSPIIVSSWYRCPKLNKALSGSAKTSMHQQALAVDCICPGIGPPLAFAQAIAELGLIEPYDQLIHEAGQWVHIGLAKENAAREQMLTMKITRLAFGRVKRSYSDGLVAV
jgi:hypothetical protein